MDIVFVSLGSKGNATLIRQGETIIQIDMGVSLRSVKQGLSVLGAGVSDISALFVTHEHSDHIKGLPLYRKATMDVYAGKGTLPSLDPAHQLHEGEAIQVGELTVLPFRSSHDAYNPMNFIILGGGKKFGYVTDTGLIKSTGVALLHDCNYYLMESNYGLKELMEGPYPPVLKRRIHGKKGHLSNKDSALYFCEFFGPKTEQVFLGHISLENNTPELALATYQETLREEGVDCSNVKIIAIPQLTMQIGGSLL
ncbi:MAG: MBL fold metallo-hydrolase [Bacilli bacterium]|nr:MBL fold metallo-hydrolase [Bacilli bacterium]